MGTKHYKRSLMIIFSVFNAISYVFNMISYVFLVDIYVMICKICANVENLSEKDY